MHMRASEDSHHIRRLDVRLDTLEVADVIETCFGNQMDDEGREYLAYLRHSASDSPFIRWVPGSNERVSTPLHGYVWEENGAVVGNLTLIPFYYEREWFYLIANVAVLPEYRRRGIARALTLRALRHIREHQVRRAWLHVRQDNPAAQELYLSLGFQERCRRTSWIHTSHAISPFIAPRGMNIAPRRAADWPQQVQWLELNYPADVRWNMNIHLNKYATGFWDNLRRFLEGSLTKHWTATLDGELVGVITWTPVSGRSVTLLVSAGGETETEAVKYLLQFARWEIREDQTLYVNYPADKAGSAFIAAGFRELNTLIWMEKRFE